MIPAGVDRVGRPLLAGAAEVIDQQVAGQGGDPGVEAALGRIEAAQVGVELDEDILGQVFGVMGGGGEAVTEGVDPALLGHHQFRPGAGIAIEAATHQCGPIHLRRFGPSFGRRLPARTTFSFRRRVRRGVQRGRSSASRIAPPVIGLKALTCAPRFRRLFKASVAARLMGADTHRSPASVPLALERTCRSIAAKIVLGRKRRRRFFSATTPGNSAPATSPGRRAER